MTASPRAKWPSIRMTPTGNRLLPRRSAATAPASMVSVPFGSSEPAIHFLREVTGLPAARNQVERRALGNRLQADDRPGPMQSPCGCPRGGDLAGLDLGLHAAARQLGADASRHRLDLGRDALHHRHALGVGVGAGRRVVEPVDVGSSTSRSALTMVATRAASRSLSP